MEFFYCLKDRDSLVFVVKYVRGLLLGIIYRVLKEFFELFELF